MRKKKLFLRKICVLVLILSTALLSACSDDSSDGAEKYVVLIGEDSEITDKLSDIDLLVIDAEYFSKNDIARLREMVSVKSSPISISDRSRASGPMIQTLRNILWVPMRTGRRKNGSMSQLRNGRHVQLPE